MDLITDVQQTVLTEVGLTQDDASNRRERKESTCKLIIYPI
jgi:hypothetical protein